MPGIAISTAKRRRSIRCEILVGGQTVPMDLQPIAAYVSQEQPLEITVNFGLIAGREATRTDIDRLAEALLRLVGGASLFAGQRYEFASGSAEVGAYQVQIAFPPYTLPEQTHEYTAMVQQLVESASLWARECGLTPSDQPEDLAQRILHGPPGDTDPVGIDGTDLPPAASRP